MHIALHFLVWPIAFAAAAAAVLAPHWTHALDDGRNVTVAATDPVPAGGTRNVVLTGYPYLPGALIVTTTTRMNGSTVSRDERVLVPVVGDAWKEGEPVRFVLSAPASALEHSDALVRAAAGVRGDPEQWRGSVRTALWEGGFSEKERELFASGGAPLAADAVTVAVMAPDWLWAYGATGAAFFMGLFVAEGVRQRRSNPEAKAQA